MYYHYGKWNLALPLVPYSEVAGSTVHVCTVTHIELQQDKPEPSPNGFSFYLEAPRSHDTKLRSYASCHVYVCTYVCTYIHVHACTCM